VVVGVRLSKSLVARFGYVTGMVADRSSGAAVTAEVEEV
jgi:hypothetical protein